MHFTPFCMASMQALSALLKCNTALSLRLKAPSILFVFMTILAFDSPRGHRPCQRPLKGAVPPATAGFIHARSEEHTSELQSLMRTSYAVFCLKQKIECTE